MISHVFISFNAVQIYDLSYSHLYSSPPTGILQTYKNDQLLVGLIAQLAEHCAAGITEFMGRNPIQALTFFRFNLQLLKLCAQLRLSIMSLDLSVV